MRELEVRCCCDPGKLLGYLQVPDESAHNGVRLLYHVPLPVSWQDPAEPPRPVRPIELEVRVVQVGFRRYLAVRSNDHPLETLLRLPWFRPADGR